MTLLARDTTRVVSVSMCVGWYLVEACDFDCAQLHNAQTCATSMKFATRLRCASRPVTILVRICLYPPLTPQSIMCLVCAFCLCYLLRVFEQELLLEVDRLDLYRHDALSHVSVDYQVSDTCVVGQHRRDKYSRGFDALIRVYQPISIVPKIT